MKKIGIIGAMQVEIDFLVQLMADKCSKTQEGTLIFYEGKIHGKDVVVVKSGVGKVNAALCAQRLIMNYKCTNIIIHNIFSLTNTPNATTKALNYDRAKFAVGFVCFIPNVSKSIKIFILL